MMSGRQTAPRYAADQDGTQYLFFLGKVVCSTCGTKGHLSDECSASYCKACEVYGHAEGQCAEACSTCGKDHSNPNTCKLKRACNTCSNWGHTAADCPWRQCNRCQYYGHRTKDCAMRSDAAGVQPLMHSVAQPQREVKGQLKQQQRVKGGQPTQHASSGNGTAKVSSHPAEATRAKRQGPQQAWLPVRRECDSISSSNKQGESDDINGTLHQMGPPDHAAWLSEDQDNSTSGPICTSSSSSASVLTHQTGDTAKGSSSSSSSIYEVDLVYAAAEAAFAAAAAAIANAPGSGDRSSGSSEHHTTANSTAAAAAAVAAAMAATSGISSQEASRKCSTPQACGKTAAAAATAALGVVLDPRQQPCDGEYQPYTMSSCSNRKQCTVSNSLSATMLSRSRARSSSSCGTQPWLPAAAAATAGEQWPARQGRQAAAVSNSSAEPGVAGAAGAAAPLIRSAKALAAAGSKTSQPHTSSTGSGCNRSGRVSAAAAMHEVVVFALAGMHSRTSRHSSSSGGAAHRVPSILNSGAHSVAASSMAQAAHAAAAAAIAGVRHPAEGRSGLGNTTASAAAAATAAAAGTCVAGSSPPAQGDDALPCQHQQQENCGSLSTYAAQTLSNCRNGSRSSSSQARPSQLKQQLTTAGCYEHVNTSLRPVEKDKLAVLALLKESQLAYTPRYPEEADSLLDAVYEQHRQQQQQVQIQWCESIVSPSVHLAMLSASSSTDAEIAEML